MLLAKLYLGMRLVAAYRIIMSKDMPRSHGNLIQQKRNLIREAEYTNGFPDRLRGLVPHRHIDPNQLDYCHVKIFLRFPQRPG